MNREELNERLVIKNTKRGRGICTRIDLPLFSRLCTISGKKITFQETLKLQDESYALQTGCNEYIVPDFPFYLFNHSCDPNCGINHYGELITIKPVAAGEELCWDYSTSMFERHWKMKCICGSKICRKEVLDFDLLPVNVQQRYIEMGIVLPYVLEEVQRLKHDYSPN